MADLTKLRIEREEEPRSSGVWGKLIMLVVLLVIVAGGYFLYRGPLHPAHQVEVTTVTSVYPSQASSILNASGYVVAQRKAEVASKATGRLEQLLVEEGSEVKKNAVIGRLESRDVQADLEQAKADVEVAKATMVQSKAEFERQKKLLDAQFTSVTDYDAAEAAYKRAVASVASAEARVRSAEVNLDNTYIRAPFDGTVLTKNADVGEIVAPFGSAGNSKGTVVSMADMDSLQVEADVSESNIERIKVGQPCEITLDAFPEKRYRGVVHMIVPTADRAKATVLTKIRFQDQDERVLPEMSAKVAFLTEQISESQINAKPKLVVDPGAVLERNGKKIVFLMQGEQVQERKVSLGQMVGNAAEVLSGLSAGDTVVLHPPADMKTGDKVRVGT